MDKCLFNKNNKGYIVPTKEWLKPLGELIIKKTTPNTVGMLMIAELIDKEKIIVKITSSYNKKLMIFGRLLFKEPNFIKTYCVFPCYENLKSYKNKYKDEVSFCNGEQDKEHKLITLEILKRYSNGDLTNLVNKLSIIETKKILEQLLLAQLNAFYKYGFVHNDINLTNILFSISNSANEYNYCVCADILGKQDNPSCIITTKKLKQREIIPVIFDFDKSKCYNPKIFSRYSRDFFNEYDLYDEDILIVNLKNTIISCLKLINKLDNVELYKSIEKNIIMIIDSSKYTSQWYVWNVKLLDKFYRKAIDWEYFRDSTIKSCVIFVNSIIKIFDKDIELIPQTKCITNLEFKKI